MNISIKRAAIPKEFSTYLDFLRFGAAMLVLLFHIKKFQIGPVEIARFIPDHGHDAVILFFVLSGYVIAATVDRKRSKGLREFALDRMARVYSVAIPTLVFCLVLSLFLQEFLDPEKHSGDAINHPVLTFFANIFFIGQSWSLQLQPFINNPYWSLCYEVMYYLAFGIFTFMTGWKRWVGIIAVAIVAGPKVVILFPCWAMGVVAYQARDMWKMEPKLAAAVAFVLPVAVLLILHVIHFGPHVRELTSLILGSQENELSFSSGFLIDYMTAVLVAVHLYAARYLHIQLPGFIRSFITAGASMSFTLYLLHNPLLFLVVGLVDKKYGQVPLFLSAAVGVPLICYGVSFFHRATPTCLQDLAR